MDEEVAVADLLAVTRVEEAVGGEVDKVEEVVAMAPRHRAMEKMGVREVEVEVAVVQEEEEEVGHAGVG